jgi:hypothetical protein
MMAIRASIWLAKRRGQGLVSAPRRSLSPDEYSLAPSLSEVPMAQIGTSCRRCRAVQKASSHLLRGTAGGAQVGQLDAPPEVMSYVAYIAEAPRRAGDRIEGCGERNLASFAITCNRAPEIDGGR